MLGSTLPGLLLGIGLLTWPVQARDFGPVDSRGEREQGTQLGQASFPTSCEASAQTEIERGVALLHSFQYMESGQAFDEAGKSDPKCAMAHWGKAMALYHQLWDFPQAETLKKGWAEVQEAQKLGGATERERGYIAAAAAFYQDNSKLTHTERTKAYSAAMRELYARQPKDLDAGAFYALTFIALTDEKGTDPVANLRKAISLLERLLREAPGHPGVAHYLIHAADRPELASLGLEAARRYAKIAPDSSHALHMPSHIFARLGLWQEAIESNIAAAAAAKGASEMHHSEYHYQTHAMDFLRYAYLQSGQEAKARQVAADLSSVPGASEQDKASLQSYFLTQNAIEVHQWKEAASLSVPAVKDRQQGAAYWARAIGAARSGDARGSRQNAKKLAKVVAARERYEKKMGYGSSREKAVDLSEAKAWAAFAGGKADQALKEMRTAADREDALGGESVSISARELLADLLLELKRPAEALAEYKSALKESPNRFDALYGAARAAQGAGDAAAGRDYFAKLVEVCAPGADRPELGEAKTFLARK